MHPMYKVYHIFEHCFNSHTRLFAPARQASWPSSFPMRGSGKSKLLNAIELRPYARCGKSHKNRVVI